MIQVEDGLVVPVVLEERLVGADDFGVLLEPLANARSQADDPLDARRPAGRSSREFFPTSGRCGPRGRPLDQADDRPRQVVVDDDGAVLEVLAFAEHVGRDQDSQLLFRGDTCRACRCSPG